MERAGHTQVSLASVAKALACLLAARLPQEERKVKEEKREADVDNAGAPKHSWAR